jgi:hypothetical protein
MEHQGKFLFYILFSFLVAFLLELICTSIVIMWHGSTIGGDVCIVYCSWRIHGMSGNELRYK